MFLILCMHWGIESYTVTVTVWLIDIIKLLTCTRRWGDRIHVGWKSSCSCWCYQCTCDHLHMTVMHLFIKFDGNIFIQLGYIDIIRNSIWRPPPSWIFIISEFDTFSMMLSVFRSLYQIWFKYLVYLLRTTYICSRHLTDDVMQINFRVRFFGHASISLWSCCIFILTFVQISSFRCEINEVNSIVFSFII